MHNVMLEILYKGSIWIVCEEDLFQRDVSTHSLTENESTDRFCSVLCSNETRQATSCTQLKDRAILVY